MATANLQPVDSLAQINQLLELFKGTKTSSSTSSSESTKSDISADGMTAMIKQILGSAQGLAAVSSGQKTAGLYNSTTNQLLTNDLVTRASGELAKQQAGTITTRTGNVNNAVAPKASGSNVVQLLAGQAVRQLLGPSLKNGAKKLGIDTWGDKLSDALGLSSPSTATSGTFAGLDSAAASYGSAGDVAGNFLGGGLDAGFGTGSADALSSFGSGIATDVGADALGSAATYAALDSAAASYGSGAITGGLAGGIAGEGLADYSAAYASGAATDALASGATSAAADSAGSAVAGEALGAGAGLAAGGVLSIYTNGENYGALLAPVGDAGVDFLSGVGDFASNIGDAATGWIVCTELYRQGRMPKKFYVPGAREFSTYPEGKKNGYYVWAIPSVQHLRQNPQSIYSRFLSKLFNCRAEYLAARVGIKGARKTIAGAIITKALFGFCYGLSYFVPQYDWRVVYGSR